ncbi:MAG: energy transducer TonB [Gammaproteobacteria bacterium]|nr:energy transducer TonB [Gammaproteobacteria bacterium]MCY4283569.1 energy transducer TonB [Gammaproteobacteria bacterium]
MNPSAAAPASARQLELFFAAGRLGNPALTSADRLSFTFCLALLCHALIILGIVFAPRDEATPRYEFMEITLVQQSSEPPEDAEALAQANLRGGGEANAAPAPAPPPLPQAEPAEPGPAVEAPQSEPAPQALPEAEPEPETIEQLAVAKEDVATAIAQPQVEPETTRPSATELVTDSLRMAALSSPAEQTMEASANDPKRTFISANTQKYKYAAYMEAWRAKVERVGNLNYPEEARKNKISGQLVLDVALNPDGKINQITVRRSSGHKVLDDAAIRIVELAAPFAPFPDDIRAETDILHINRTWQFIDQSGFR